MKYKCIAAATTELTVEADSPEEARMQMEEYLEVFGYDLDWEIQVSKE